MTIEECLYTTKRAVRLRRKIDQGSYRADGPDELICDDKLAELQLSEVLQLADKWAKGVAKAEHEKLLEHEKGTPVAKLREGYEGGVEV